MIAALSAWHERHEASAQARASVTALPAHVVLETFAVLTRLPGGLAAAPQPASDLLRQRFAGPPLTLDVEERAELLDRLAREGVLGGAAHDGLVGLEVAAHGETLLTLDERARATYRRLGVDDRGI